MVDEIKSNLEPIGEEDLNLKNKFAGKIESLSSHSEAPKNPTFSVGEKKERKEGGIEKDSAYSKILSQVPSSNQTVQGHNVAGDAKTVNVGIDAESKIEMLVKLAQAKGISHAVDVARHMEDNYTLDEFHDKLLGEELHDALVKNGIIKEL